MRVECVPFHVEHLTWMPEAERLDRDGVSLLVEGEVVACGGVERTDYGGHVWCGIRPRAPMVLVTRAARRFLSTLSIAVLTVSVTTSFAAGHRWAQTLGFTTRHGEIGPYTIYIRRAQ